MSHPQLPLVLRKDDHLVVAVYDEDKSTLTELIGESTNYYTGDYRECEVCFNPAEPSMFAHATTTHLRCSYVSTSEEGGFSTKLLFEQEMPHVVIEMAFSPRGTYLVTYAMMDRKRTPGGNLSVFDVATGACLLRSMQARWPAMVWTMEEEYLVRPMQGWLHVLEGNPSGEAPAEFVNSKPAEASRGSPTSPNHGGGVFSCLSKTDLMLAQDKEIAFSTCPTEGLSMLALFKPFYKQQQATLSLYRLPNLHDGALYQVPFGRSESARILWSFGGHHIALLVQSECDSSGKSYYGTVTLHLIDVLKRSTTTIRLTGDGETVHDAQWSPTRIDELLVVHGRMPQNRATLYNKSGVKLLSLGEAPRNMAQWAPNAEGFVLGGSGNLAGDYVFYAYPAGSTAKAVSEAGARPSLSASSPSLAPVCTGEFNEKCSFHSWAPDSHHFLCATLFTRLRMDNKVVLVKKNGARVVTVRYKELYGAHWVQMRPASAHPRRAPSPQGGESEQEAKPRVYCPPGGTSSRAAALLRRPQNSALGSGAAPAATVGPVGATLVEKKKKKKKH
ncbi:unnamed protein product [Phytomonas sp. EM1]|nr:unnamed protein product [Phytomonas sp. EM1]|eukprot:CCW64995.1 unnamed protein product [Phytomonas sp. isolate EM1]